MAEYRLLGLSSATGSTIVAGRATSYAERRHAAAERLSATADITRRLDDAVAALPLGAPAASPPIDPDGTLRASIRALIPLAHRTEGFDVTVSLGPTHQWAARVRHGPDGVTADLVPGPGHGSGSGHGSGPGHGSGRPAGVGSVAPAPAGASEAEVAAELAALLWTGAVGAR